MENRNKETMLNGKELEMVNGGADEFDEQKLLERGGKNYAKDFLDNVPPVLDDVPPGASDGGGVYSTGNF